MPQVFIVGATGYVGGRLRKVLESEGRQVRCLVRSKHSIPLDYPKTTEYLIGDLADPKVLSGIEVAYFLIPENKLLAEQFAKNCSLAKVKKIIYLSSLKTQHEMGPILRGHSKTTQVIEFRTSVVIGRGSLSFEMIKRLVEKASILFIPTWTKHATQPIAIDDLLKYLILAPECQLEGNHIFEIGGKCRSSYLELMREYAKQRSLKPWMVTVPFLTSFGLALFSHLHVRSLKKLMERASVEPVVHDPLAHHLFQFDLMSYQEAIKKAIEEPVAETYWTGASSGIRDWSKENFGGRFLSSKQAHMASTPENVFPHIRRIGGNLSGYYFANWAWKMRGIIDFLLGGVGLRGRRDQEELRPGDVIDFWRVIAYEPNHYLILIAEMKTPGRAILEFTLSKHEKGVEFTQKILFDPIGVLGILYWYLFYPVHQWIFRGMFRKMKKKMETQ